MAKRHLFWKRGHTVCGVWFANPRTVLKCTYNIYKVTCANCIRMMKELKVGNVL